MFLCVRRVNCVLLMRVSSAWLNFNVVARVRAVEWKKNEQTFFMRFLSALRCNPESDNDSNWMINMLWVCLWCSFFRGAKKDFVSNAEFSRWPLFLFTFRLITAHIGFSYKTTWNTAAIKTRWVRLFRWFCVVTARSGVVHRNCVLSHRCNAFLICIVFHSRRRINRCTARPAQKREPNTNQHTMHRSSQLSRPECQTQYKSYFFRGVCSTHESQIGFVHAIAFHSTPIVLVRRTIAGQKYMQRLPTELT